MIDSHGFNIVGLRLAVMQHSEWKLQPSCDTVESWISGKNPNQKYQNVLIRDIFQLPVDEAGLYRQALEENLYSTSAREAINELLKGNSILTCAILISAGLASLSETERNHTAYLLNVYPSSIDAYISGSCVPSHTIIDRLAGIWGLSSEHTAHFHDAREMDLQIMRKKNPAHALLAETLGAATTNVVISYILSDLLSPEMVNDLGYRIFEGRQVAEKGGIDEAVISKLRNERPDLHRKQRTIVDRLAIGLECDSSQTCVLTDIDRRNIPKKPFGEVLVGYVRAGGSNMGGLCKLYRKMYQLSHANLAEEFGIDENTIIRWEQKGNDIEIRDRTLNQIAKNRHLTPYQKTLLNELARGNTQISPIEEIVRDGQESMRALGWQQREEKAKLSGTIFDKLMERSGATVSAAARAIGVDPATIRAWRKSLKLIA